MIFDTNISALPRCHVVHFSPIPIHSKKFDTNTRRITRGGQVPLRTGGLQSISALRTPSSLIHEWFYWCTSWRWLLIKCSYLESFQHIPTGTGWAINRTAHIGKKSICSRRWWNSQFCGTSGFRMKALFRWVADTTCSRNAAQIFKQCSRRMSEHEI